jgi:hypothetical protein
VGSIPQQYTQASGEFRAQGNFLDPERPGALGIEDASRFRPQSYVAPRDVELMQGSFSIPGAENYTGDPTEVIKPSNKSRFTRV